MSEGELLSKSGGAVAAFFVLSRAAIAGKFGPSALPLVLKRVVIGGNNVNGNFRALGSSTGSDLVGWADGSTCFDNGAKSLGEVGVRLNFLDEVAESLDGVLSLDGIPDSLGGVDALDGAANSLGGVADSLDEANSRDGVADSLDIIGDTLRAAADSLDGVLDGVNSLGDVGDGVVDSLDGTENPSDGIDFLGGVADTLDGVDSLDGVADFLVGVTGLNKRGSLKGVASLTMTNAVSPLVERGEPVATRLTCCKE